MEPLKLEADWDKVKELMQEAAPELTDEDLQYTPGEDEKLIQRLSKKMNRSYEDTKGWIESVSHTTVKAS